jgi:redox-sensing transcriptional repressor
MDRKLLLRLIKYRRVLNQLKELGLESVFSNNLGDALDITSALVRKDFSILGISGNKRGGYNIEEVLESFDERLGSDKPIDIIIVGCGNIGKALMKYPGFAKDGLRIVAGFDSDPIKFHRDSTVPVLPMEDLESFVRKEGIKIGIIAVPSPETTGVFQKMVQAGIRGFLNFAPVELKCTKTLAGLPECPGSCTVHNMNISPELENLYYMVHMKEQMEKEEYTP